ncbi:hypothetical protein N0V90_011821 [Kalmusia sp. IMI 367209]|nr:hypothetical protein N0V90_011821 [Kalmusia sp. IMI 367209]
MSSTEKVEWKLWSYTPSVAGGVIAAIIFFILTSIHAFRLIKNRTWFCIPFIVGGLFEAIGYAGRAAAHTDLENKTPYIIQSVLILIAPILFAASIYMILGRLILRTNSASYSIVRATWVTKIFVAGDIICFFVQSGGAGMLTQAKDQDGIKRGENIILAGLVLQILIFGFFVVDGYLITHEWPLYIYDFLMMMLTLVVCITWYDPNIKPMKHDIEIGMRG